MFSKAKGAQGGSLGFAHVDFEEQRDAIKAFKDHNESPTIIEDREIRVDYAYPLKIGGSPPQMRAVKNHRKPTPIIFIAKLPCEAKEEDIREALKPLGDAIAVRAGALAYGTIQLNRILNLGLCSNRSGREVEGVRTRRICEYHRRGEGPRTLRAKFILCIRPAGPDGSRRTPWSGPTIPSTLLCQMGKR